MKTEAEIASVLPRLPLSSANTSFARRVPLAALLGVKVGDTPFGRAIVPAGLDFLFTSGRAYRYNPPGIHTLYVGEGENVATAEVKQDPGLRGFDLTPCPPATIFYVSVAVSSLLDVTNPAVQDALGTSEAELLAPWRAMSPNAPTQILGKAIFDAGFIEGIRYRSAPLAATGKQGWCVALFRDRRQAGSGVRLVDPEGVWGHQRW